MHHEVQISFAARKPWVPAPRVLRRWILAALAPLRESAVISVRIVGLAGSRTLNVRYRGRDKPTNVLSFAGAGGSPDGRRWLGELVICAPLLAREAANQAKRIDSHWAHICVHGVLHLLGHDHGKPRQAAKMESREAQILESMGISNPYS